MTHVLFWWFLAGELVTAAATYVHAAPLRRHFRRSFLSLTAGEEVLSLVVTGFLLCLIWPVTLLGMVASSMGGRP